MSVPNSNLPEELRSLPWYVPNIGTKLGDKMRILLEDYGGIPRYQQQEHIHRIVSEPRNYRSEILILLA
jgi:hypothetical protein